MMAVRLTLAPRGLYLIAARRSLFPEGLWFRIFTWYDRYLRWISSFRMSIWITRLSFTMDWA